jgi:biotin carboxyl carrier protein
MKMQNLLQAERAGVAQRLGVKVGHGVATDDVLIEFA